MRVYKEITVQGIAVQLHEADPKDLSRVRLRIMEDGDRNRMHTTPHYADITEDRLHWKEPLTFVYTGQQKLVYETFCEHEYGYEKGELKVLYEGVYYLRNDMFFKRDTTHAYSPTGEVMGTLSWTLSLHSRQQALPEHTPHEEVIPLVREDLIGMIKVQTGQLEITNPSFNRKKHQGISLRIGLGDNVQEGERLSGYKWNMHGLKLEWVLEGPQEVQFQMEQDGRVVLEGSTQCKQIQAMRRYIQQRVPIFSRTGVKIGSLLLDLRYLQKHELLDLLYSPQKKLAHSQSTEHHPKKPESSRSNSNSGFEEGHRTLLSKLGGSRVGLGSSHKHSNSFFAERKKHISPKDRYKIGYLMNQNSDILMNKSPRFDEVKANSPKVSYIDPQNSSEFSKKRKRGWHIGKTNKSDFTTQFKHNPGVGQYHLPSIWSKY